jgi:hypothetical protein
MYLRKPVGEAFFGERLVIAFHKCTKYFLADHYCEAQSRVCSLMRWSKVALSLN